MGIDSLFKNTALEGKVALITGGGSGIGFEIATQFGLHGARVAIMGRQKPVLDAAVASLESLGIKVFSSLATLYGTDSEMGQNLSLQNLSQHVRKA